LIKAFRPTQKDQITIYPLHPMNTLLLTIHTLMIMTHSLPTLPYEMDALAPRMSRETLEYHYGKHLKTYIDNLNNLIAGTPFAEMPLEEICVKAEGPIFNNGAQAWNHIFFFNSFSPSAQAAPSGALADAIDRDFGSLEAFKEQFGKAATTLFGSGWVWLCADKEGKLSIVAEPNAGNPLKKGLTPLLCIDVWEHAYYIDYRNRRPEFVKNFWDLVDWKVVEQRYADK
jgi:Fe-Mn family superoxide dismutase